MHKREITYENFNDETVTETFYFNLSKPELIELEVEYKEGFTSWIQSVVKAEDNKTILEQFKRIILLAYGEKSADGRSFLKSDELREQFSHTAAFQSLFLDLCTDASVAAEFLIAALPKDMRDEVAKAVNTSDISASDPTPTT